MKTRFEIVYLDDRWRVVSTDGWDNYYIAATRKTRRRAEHKRDRLNRKRDYDIQRSAEYHTKAQQESDTIRHAKERP